MLNSLNGSKIIAKKFGGYCVFPLSLHRRKTKKHYSPLTIYFYVTLHTFTRSKPNH